jgi:hypothetical protein
VAIAIANTLEFLLGRWSIERVIHDHRDNTVVRFSGVAVVEPDGSAGASYLEQGRVTLGAHAGPAQRRLRFSEREDGTVRVDFQDGRPFLDLDLSTGGTRATHPCRADTYEMAFEVLGLDELLERWRVTGPDKDYDAETAWRRS